MFPQWFGKSWLYRIRGFVGGFKRKVYGGKDLQHEHVFPVGLCLIFPSACPALGRFTVMNSYVNI